VDAYTFTKQAKKVYTNIVCQKVDGKCSPGQERSTDGEIHAIRDHNNISSVLQHTHKHTKKAV
jgi:hypothetical protein